MRILLCRVFAAKGFSVESAPNGQEALLKIQAARPDLVVLDLMMPVMDGWEVLRRLRAVRDPPPVLVVSAHLDRARALREGAASCLTKPFRLGEILGACRRILAQQEDAC